jgi:hypothetical protein
MQLNAWEQFLAGVLFQRTLAILALIAALTLARAAVTFAVPAADFLGMDVSTGLESILTSQHNDISKSWSVLQTK